MLAEEIAVTSRKRKTATDKRDEVVQTAIDAQTFEAGVKLTS